MNDCFMLKLTSSGPFKKITNSLIPKHVWRVWIYGAEPRITTILLVLFY